ncbi:MAG: bifunctional folylpolyglutamate synthase/dihydrofolate synthase [Nitrospirae bacterium]|nr:MAG: bifunctional folylpolyglutamate synthase/dihydrofolate synthase [Nitrospirota bacterium]
MSYPAAIDYLYGLQKFGIKLGLDKTKAIMSELGDPFADFKTVHVAGTNGKGSVSAMTASILQAHGFKVGLFTSPHLVSFTERIRINGKRITEEEVVSLTSEIRDGIAGLRTVLPEPTFFEFVTAMAFLYFKRNGVDWAVIETGMGGRLDATNLIMPAVSVITKIGLDHKEFLGETIKDIAFEKAGIIKAGVPVVSASQPDDAAQVINAAALKNGSKLFIYGNDFSGDLWNSAIDGIAFGYRNGASSLDGLRVRLAGEHQLENACLAVKAAMTALGEDIKYSAVARGLNETRWAGRLEFIQGDPPMLIDGAHNPDAAESLSCFVGKHLAGKNIILVLGIMADKDIDGILKQLLPSATSTIFCAPNYGRAASAGSLAAKASQIGFSNTETASSVYAALQRAREISLRTEAPLILITGSFYTIGEAKELLGEKAVLGDLRETV